MAGNVSGFYPSRKMKRTIQFESHRNELAAILEMEHDPDVIEFYDQPNSIQLHYRTEKGKAISVLHTPDYFVIHQASAGWIECKTEEQLLKLAESQPNRFVSADRNRRRIASKGLVRLVTNRASAKFDKDRNYEAEIGFGVTQKSRLQA